MAERQRYSYVAGGVGCCICRSSGGSDYGCMIGTSLNDLSSTLPVFQESLREKTAGLLLFLGGFGINISDPGITEAFDPGIAMKLVVRHADGVEEGACQWIPYSANSDFYSP